jgi:adenylate cyclase
MFLSARESDFHAKTTDMGLARAQKLNYVDLSGRNLVTIPISLYSKAMEIISLNLSRNLSLDVPRLVNTFEISNLTTTKPGSCHPA